MRFQHKLACISLTVAILSLSNISMGVATFHGYSEAGLQVTSGSVAIQSSFISALSSEMSGYSGPGGSHTGMATNVESESYEMGLPTLRVSSTVDGTLVPGDADNMYQTCKAYIRAGFVLRNQTSAAVNYSLLFTGRSTLQSSTETAYESAGAIARLFIYKDYSQINSWYTATGPGGPNADSGPISFQVNGLLGPYSYVIWEISTQDLRGAAYAVPEPASCVLLACGSIALGYRRRRRL